MGNVSELLINAVTINKPKLLIGLSQKARGRLSPCGVEIRSSSDHRWRGRP